MVAFRVFNIDVDRCSISHIPHTALLRRYLVSDTVFLDEGHSDSDISEFEVELGKVIAIRVSISGDKRVCSNDLLYLAIDEVVKRIDMLLD